jgi:hypothetical protein
MSKSVALYCALAVLACGAFSEAQAQAKAQVSAAAGKLLQEAQAASKSGKWADCLSKLRQAEAAPGRNSYDSYVINELRGFCALRSNDFSTAVAAFETNLASQFVDPSQIPSRTKSIIQLYYNARNYAKAVEFGQRAIEQGSADNDIYLLVAQSYYVQKDYTSARDFVRNWMRSQERRGQRPRENAIQIYLTSCINLKDAACQTEGFEKLVTYYPNPESWQNLMQSLFRSRSEVVQFNAFRLASEVGALTRADDYTEMAQLALERGLPGEAQAALEKAFAQKLFTEKRDIDRNTRLLQTAKERATQQRAGLAKAERDAAAGATGDAQVTVGQAFLSYGQAEKAVAAIQAGIKKGSLTSAPEAQLALGMALLKAGNKPEARRAFSAIKGDGDLERIGKLWALRAR